MRGNTGPRYVLAPNAIPRDTRNVNGKTMHVVKLLFYQYGDMTMEEGERQQGETWNWLAACWTGGGCGVTTERVSEEHMTRWADGTSVPEPIFTHVELRFSDGYGTSITSTGNQIHYERRLHTRQNYSFVCEYLMSEEDEGRAQAMAKHMFKSGITFNRAGFILNFLPLVGYLWAGERSDGSVFCSEYIVSLLHETRRLLDINPHTTSPQALYHRMLDEIRDGRAIRSWNREAGTAIRQGLINPQLQQNQPSRPRILRSKNR